MKRKDKDITYVCPKCGKEVSWTKITMSDGNISYGLDWNCKKCGASVITFCEKE